MTLDKWYAVSRSVVFPAIASLTVIMPTLLHFDQINLLYGVLFFWIVANPNAISYGLILFLSLFQDILTHAYLGIHQIFYAVFIGFLVSQRRQLLNRSFLLIWSAFFVTLFGLTALKYFFNYIMHAETVSLSQLILETVIPVLIFPLIFKINAWLYTKVFYDYA